MNSIHLIIVAIYWAAGLVSDFSLMTLKPVMVHVAPNTSDERQQDDHICIKGYEAYVDDWEVKGG